MSERIIEYTLVIASPIDISIKINELHKSSKKAREFIRGSSHLKMAGSLSGLRLAL